MPSTCLSRWASEDNEVAVMMGSSVAWQLARLTTVQHHYHVGSGEVTRQLLQGVPTTLELAAVGAVVSLAAGAVLGFGRARGPWFVRQPIIWFVELIRGLPEILQLFILYFGLTQFQINLSPLTAGLIWMCVYGAGYAVEIFRAGLVDIPPGQDEAARALGLRRTTTFGKIILPQAVRVMLPSLTSFVILELKNSTLVYYIGVIDIMNHASGFVNNGVNPLMVYSIAAGFYIVLSVVLGRAGALVERRMAW